jgi:hypothetical protein
LGYFIYCGGNHAIFNNPFIQLKITYTSGFVDIPVKLKQATAMIAQNIAQSKSYSGIKSLQDLDVSVAMWDDSFITSDIRMMLQEYRSV